MLVAMLPVTGNVPLVLSVTVPLTPPWLSIVMLQVPLELPLKLPENDPANKPLMLLDMCVVASGPVATVAPAGFTAVMIASRLLGASCVKSIAEATAAVTTAGSMVSVPLAAAVLLMDIRNRTILITLG